MATSTSPVPAPRVNNFKKRRISLVFQLGEGRGEFGEPQPGRKPQDTITIEGLRCSVNVIHDGLQFARADVQVWGMPLDLMNKLTVTQKFFFEQPSYNSMRIMAGDESSMAVCFSGGIMEAWADGRQQPDIMFHVTAATGLVEMVQVIPPTSYNGPVDVGTMVKHIADQLGYGFENSGVKAILNSPYKPGSPKSQVASICRDVDCEWTVDDVNNVIAIWPKKKHRRGEPTVISAKTGLIGYPAYTQGGLQFSTLYNPALDFAKTVRVSTPFTPANGLWKVSGLSHRLESNVPDGQWFTDVETSYIDYKP